MSFQWDVQPYRWLYELRAHYTSAVVTTMKTSAQNKAEEAEQWMKDHAPWEDRSITLRQKLGFTGKNARQSLFVRVVVDEAQQKAYEAGLSVAKKADRKLLTQLNRERRGEAARRTVKGTVVQGVGVRTESQFKAIALKKVPTHLSNVVAFEKKFYKESAPVVQLEFSHGRNIPYAIWLEIARNGRYAIIARALEYWGNKFMAEIRSRVNLVQYRGMAIGEMESQSSQFQNYVARQNEKLASQGRPAYQPWSQEIKQERSRRRKYYNPQKARAWRERRLEEEAAEAESFFRRNEPDTSLRTYQPQKAQTFSIGTQNRRATRR